MKKSEIRKFEIASKKYELKPLTLEQDELLAPIVREMLETFSEMFEKLASLIPPSSDVSGEESTPSIPPPDRGRLDEGLSSIELVVDILKINVWLHEKRYVRRLLAVLLTEEGQEFDESQVAEREKIMAKVGREVAPEVIPFFFEQSGIFGTRTQRFSPETRTIPKTH